MRMAVIETHAAEAYPQRPGHRGFALSRVRARMLTAVAAPDLPCACRIQPLELRGGDNSYSSQTRRNEVDYVVKPRGHAPEITIGRLRMTNHGIERVDRFIRHRSGSADGSEPEQRSHNAIAGALGESLNDGPGDFGLVETRGIATHNACQSLSRQIKIVRFERPD